MNNPAFLIDGFMEKLILENLCPDTKINRINCNGNAVSIRAIAKRVSSLIRILNNIYYPIFILIDREDREQTPQQIIDALEEEIRSEGIKDDVRIGVCDRMIENWTLADWQSFKKSIGIDKATITPLEIEGCNGKAKVKKFYPNYQETTDGVSFFLNANPAVIFKNSESFRIFISKTKDINCFWSNNLFSTII
jgi:hypothetical protein